LALKVFALVLWHAVRFRCPSVSVGDIVVLLVWGQAGEFWASKASDWSVIGNRQSGGDWHWTRLSVQPAGSYARQRPIHWVLW